MNHPDKISILILPSWYPPAGGGFFRDHAEVLSREEYNVKVVVNRMMGVTKTPLWTIIKSLRKRTMIENGVLVQRRGFIKLPLLEKWSVQLWISTYIKQIKQFIREYGKPDIIITHSAIWAGTAAVRIQSDFSIPVILVEHRSRFASDDQVTAAFFKKWHITLLKQTYAQVSRIVIVSKSLEKSIRYYTPPEKAKISVIPNLVNTEYFSPSATVKNKSRFTFITVAFLEEVKGISYLLEAFQLFTARTPGHFELQLAGSGKLEKDLRYYANSLGIGGKVNFLGHLSREEVRTRLQEADVFVLPSIAEAFGVAVIEAMATGLPVVATESGGPQHIVTGDTGIIVPVRDSAKLANAMEKIYADYACYDKHKIRSHVMNNFSPRAVYLQWKQMISEVNNESTRT